MKVAVLGAGLMGKEVVRDLIQSATVEKVALADIELKKGEQVCNLLQADKLTAFQVDASNQEQLATFIKDYDVVVNALFYSFNERVAKTAIEVGVNAVDLGGHIDHVTDRVLKLNSEAIASDTTIIPDLGVAPGMINILAGYGASKLDTVKTIKMYVGGIPVRPDPPLEYNHVFSMAGVFDHYTYPSIIIRNGFKQEIPSLTEVELIYFDQFGPLEAFHTSGGTSTLAYSFPNLKELEYKTIRYPGHAEKCRLLVDLNLTRDDIEVDVHGQKVKPREVFLKLLDPIVDLKNKKDVVLLRVIVSGELKGKEKTYIYEMKTYRDEINNVTAMARVTANTISIVAKMIGNGQISKRGVFPPEQIVPGKEYISEMGKRGILISELVL